MTNIFGGPDADELLTLQAVEASIQEGAEGGEIHGGGGSQFVIIARTFISNKLAVVGTVIVVGLIIFSFLGPHLYHSNQDLPSLINVHLSPGAGHPLGTDQNGYDILGRLMLGGQVTIEVAFGVAFFTIVVGVLWGAVAGFFGGVLDAAMMRFVDILLAIPALYFYIDLSKVVKTTEWTLIILLSLLLWLGPSRLVRGETLSLRSREYVQAVTVMGGKPSRIILRHLVPNAVGTIVVQTTFLIADAIFFLTILQYLGLGLQPTVPTWGNMLDAGTTFQAAGYWWMLYPVLILIVLAILAFSFIGDALRDSLDVRLQER
jgi:peptide/nickel transport system permease protein